LSTCFSHPAVPLAIVCWFPSRRRPSRLITGGLLSAGPDLDSIGSVAGVPYGARCGPRGFTHSRVFAAVVALALTPWLAWRNDLPRARCFVFLFAAAASHGLIDMATNGGLGIALLWPFDADRLFWPVCPLEVPPLGVRAFFTERGLEVLASEAIWLWLPAVVLGAIGLFVRRHKQPPEPAP
jgi:inner membrane protein